MNVAHGFHATMTTRPGQAQAVIDLLAAAPAMTHPDCVVFLVGRSASDPDVVHVTEGWTTREAHEAFGATEGARSVIAALQPLLAGESAYADEVPVAGKAAF